MPGAERHQPAITLDRSHRPAYVVRFDGSVTAADMAAHIEAMSEILAENKRYCVLVDLRKSAGTARDALKLNAEWNRKNRAKIEKLCVGSAIVITGAVTRAALSAALWMQPIPGPYAIFQDHVLAEKWLRQRLREARMAGYDQGPSFLEHEA